jgi:endonuclease YncB( thermonuclease family)
MKKSMTRKSIRFLILLIVAFLLTPALRAGFGLAESSGDQEIRLRDGDSFLFGDAEIRLWRIDAPELLQTCRRSDNREYDCGRAAKAFLQRLIDGKTIRCEERSRAAKERRTVARCFTGDSDLAQAMVENGHAIDHRYFSQGFYADAESAAQKRHLGVWQGPFEDPGE